MRQSNFWKIPVRKKRLILRRKKQSWPFNTICNEAYVAVSPINASNERRIR